MIQGISVLGTSMSSRWGAWLLACLAVGALSLASSQAAAQCTVADCPAGSNIDTTPPYIGTNGVDCFIGTAGPDVMDGRNGDDFLCGGGGNDTISGGNGNDTIFGEEGNDILDGENNDDTIFGGPGSDNIDGGNGDNTLFGEAGADTIVAGNGVDSINGGDDNDVILAGGGADEVFGGDGDDQIDGEGGDDTNLDGGAGEDTINGGNGDDIINGGTGNDFISGGGNNDTIQGGDGRDLINGDGGNDIINGGADNDTLDGGNGTDTVNGNSGRDVCLNLTTTDGSCELLTHAAVASFSAFEDAHSVVVRWVTTAETNTVGFRLYVEQDGDWSSLHDGVLPALLAAPQGGTYDFRDESAAPGESRRYLLVEVDAHGAESRHGPFAASADSEGESLLNGDAMFARRARTSSHPSRATKASTANKQSGGEPIAIYLGVEQTGLYAVPAAEIAARFDLDESSIRDRIAAGELSLTEEGEPIAWRPSQDGAALEFFGVERKSLYTRERIYRLSLDSGITMSDRSAAPDTITEGLTYEGRLHLESDEIPGVLVAQDPERDYWFWQYISASPAMPKSAAITFEAESVAGEGELRIELHGVFDEVHSVDVRLNGTLLGVAQFEGVVPHEATFPVPAAALLEGENALTIEPSALGESGLYFNFADLTYTRAYETAEASLLFDSTVDASIEVIGLAESGTELFDITDPRRPVHLVDAEQTATGLELATEAEGKYFAVAPAHVRAPTSIWNDVPSDLRNRANAASYLIIAPAELMAAAQALGDHRELDGFDTMLVELQDVYDEYAHGTPDPNAIRAFLADAHERWETFPDFVVLIGTGSFDYRDLWGAGGNLFPPLMTLTEGGILSSDTKYADFLGDDGTPDVSLGRIPVTSVGELQSVIEQILAYEAQIDALPNEVALLADATDSQSDFAASSDSAAADLPNDWSVAPIYRSELPDLESTRALLFDEVRKGPRVLGYLGHGALESLGKTETLLAIADLETMTIDGTQPVFASMTCVSSRFAAPGFSSLGEAMLIDEEGAIAVWGPSGLSINEQATPLMHELFAQLSGGQETRIGRMVDNAFAVLEGSEHAREMMAIYHLFGDPALRVAKVSDTGGTGGSPGVGGSGGNGGIGNDVVMAGCNVRPMSGNTPAALLFIGTLALVWRRRRA